jgi:hypothetical protein
VAGAAVSAANRHLLLLLAAPVPRAVRLVVSWLLLLLRVTPG